MRTTIVISAFVLVACLCFQANAAANRALQVPGPDGKILPCKNLPADLNGKCVKYSCDNAGAVSVLGCSLSNIRCKAGQVLDEGAEDLNKPYPDCCPRPTCRAA